MSFFKPRRPPQPSAKEIASIDDVVEVQATVVNNDASPNASSGGPSKFGGFTVRSKAKTTEHMAQPMGNTDGAVPRWGGLFKAASPDKRSSEHPVKKDVIDAEEVHAAREPAYAERTTAAVHDHSFADFSTVSESTPIVAEVPKTDTESGAAPPSKPTPRKSFFNRASKSKPANADKAAKRASSSSQAAEARKETPSAKNAPRAGSGLKETVLCLEVGVGTHVLWRVGTSELAPLPTGTSAQRALSFTSHDHLLAVDAKVSARTAQDLAISETGQDCSIVNLSRGHLRLAATPTHRVFGNREKLAPGSAALLMLLATQTKPLEPRVVGLNLVGDGQQVLILYVWGPSGLSVEPGQVVVNPSDVGFSVSEFAASRRLNAEDVNALFFDNDELLAVAHKVEPYPNEPLLLGVSASKAWYAMSMVAVAASAAVSYMTYTEYRNVQSVRQQLQHAQQQQAQATQDASKLLEQRVESFASAMSVNVQQSLQRAQALWVPGTTLALEAKADSESYELTMPLVRGGDAGSLPSVAHALSPEEVSALVDLSAPSNCTRTGLTVNGTLNEVQLTVTCENGASGLSRYRLD